MSESSALKSHASALIVAAGGVRGQVLETIVRQALAGAPWQQVCAGPMQANDITPDEVEVEVQRRKASS